MGTMSLVNWHFRCYAGNGRRHSRIVTARIFAVIIALISIATLRAFAGDVVEIRLRGHYFSEPATVQITVAVEPDAANKVLRVEADGDRLYRSTEVTLLAMATNACTPSSSRIFPPARTNCAPKSSAVTTCAAWPRRNCSCRVWAADSHAVGNSTIRMLVLG
jgi:hypothetical protein